MKFPLVVILGTVGLAVSYNQRMLDPLTVVISRDAGFALDSVVLFSSAFLLPYALGQPLIGPMADSIGKARVLRLSMATILLADLMAFFVTSYEGLFALRVLAGLGAGGIIPVSIALIADRTPIEKRQVALSHFMSVLMVGQLYASPLSAYISQKMGWQYVYPTAAIFAALSLAMLFWQLQPNPNAVRRPFSVRQAAGTYRQILSSPVARACFLGVFCESVFIFSFLPHIAPYLEMKGYGGAIEAGYVLAAMGVGGMIYAASVSFLAKRYSLFGLMKAGGILASAGLVGMAFAPSWGWLALAVSVAGYGFYMLHSGLQTCVTEVMPQSRASVVSLHAFFFFIGFGVGPIVFGQMLNRTGSVFTFLFDAAAILIASLAVTQFLKARGASKPA